MFEFNDILQRLIITIPPILLAVTVHELSHGYVAYKFGDPTAKMLGRLTLNPISHLDLFGTLAFLITQTIGWAKPVPVNPYNLRNPRKDMIWISFAGPLSNLLLAVILAVILKIILALPSGTIPKFFLTPIQLMLFVGVQINVGLAIFNLLPIPPLDGGKIMEGLLPRNLAYTYSKIEPFGFIIIIVLLFTNIIDIFIVPIIKFIVSLLLMRGF